MTMERAALRRIDAFARWSDEAFRLPGTDFRFGLDSLIGLVPGIGDAFGFVVSLWLVGEALRAGAPVRLVGRMVFNLLVDAAIGSVPLAGDVFDAVFKANKRNRNLLRRHLAANP